MAMTVARRCRVRFSGDGRTGSSRGRPGRPIWYLSGFGCGFLSHPSLPPVAPLVRQRMRRADVPRNSPPPGHCERRLLWSRGYPPTTAITHGGEGPLVAGNCPIVRSEPAVPLELPNFTVPVYQVSANGS